MDGLCKGGCSSQAMELLQMMISKRHRPNIVTYSTLLNGLCKEGKLQEAVEILDRMKLQGLKPDAGLYGKIISCFCDNGKYQEAANFLDEMVLGGITPNRLTWSLHIRTHNTVVQGLCKTDPNRAFQVYLSMRNRSISVDSLTYSSLITCFCKKGDIHKSARIVDELVLDGCLPDEGTWSAVMTALWDRRKMRQAAELLLLELMNKCVEAEVDIQNQDV